MPYKSKSNRQAYTRAHPSRDRVRVHRRKAKMLEMRAKMLEIRDNDLKRRMAQDPDRFVTTLNSSVAKRTGPTKGVTTQNVINDS